MPTALELKKAQETLNAQIVKAEWEEREADEARLRAEVEARAATEQARREEEEDKWE